MKWRGIVTVPGLVLCIYLLQLFTRLLDTTALSAGNGYLTVGVLQLLIYLLPAAIYCKLRGEKFRTHLRIRPVGLEQFLVVLAGAVVLICGGLLIGFALGGMEQLGDQITLYDRFAAANPDGPGDLLYAVLAFALLPAICEEFVFRAILCAEFEINGLAAAVIGSALFFAMLHFELAQFPIYFFAGILLALVFYATRSVLGPIIVHLCYNLFGLFGRPYITEFYDRTGSTALFIFLLIVLLLLALALFFGEAARTYSGYARKEIASPYHRARTAQEKAAHPFFEVLLTPLALVCALLYLVVIMAA